LKTEGTLAFIGAYSQSLDSIYKRDLVPTWIVGIRVRVIGQSRVEILNVIHFIRVLGKRTPNLRVQIEPQISQKEAALEFTVLTFSWSSLLIIESTLVEGKVKASTLSLPLTHLG